MQPIPPSPGVCLDEEKLPGDTVSDHDLRIVILQGLLRRYTDLCGSKFRGLPVSDDTARSVENYFNALFHRDLPCLGPLFRGADVKFHADLVLDEAGHKVSVTWEEHGESNNDK